MMVRDEYRHFFNPTKDYVEFSYTDFEVQISYINKFWNGNEKMAFKCKRVLEAFVKIINKQSATFIKNFHLLRKLSHAMPWNGTKSKIYAAEYFKFVYLRALCWHLNHVINERFLFRINLGMMTFNVKRLLAFEGRLTN